MSRQHAILIDPTTGYRYRITRAEAYALVASGPYVIQSRSPKLVITTCSEYEEELRQQSGYLVNRSLEPSQAQYKHLLAKGRRTMDHNHARYLRRSLRQRRSDEQHWKGRKGARVIRTRKPRRAYD